MYRKELAERLESGPVAVRELARELGMDARELAQDLTHLRKSLRNEQGELEITPAECRKCGFVFGEDKLVKPGKCPTCRGTWIRDTQVSVRR